VIYPKGYCLLDVGDAEERGLLEGEEASAIYLNLWLIGSLNQVLRKTQIFGRTGLIITIQSKAK
jgi:hypothetical protein